MRIRLAIKYSLIIFAVTFLVAGFITFISGVIYCGFSPCETPIPLWVNVVKGFSVLFSTIICFVFLSKNNKAIAWALGSQVVAITWLASYPLNVMLMGIPQQRWLASIIGLVIAMTLGVVIGQRINKNEKSPNKSSNLTGANDAPPS